jgi:hypothetical protein
MLRVHLCLCLWRERLSLQQLQELAIGQSDVSQSTLPLNKLLQNQPVLFTLLYSGKEANKSAWNISQIN